ncbi:MAG: hypothetical protein ACI92S_005190, partial [Planctomycetaceae bacterium]
MIFRAGAILVADSRFLKLAVLWAGGGVLLAVGKIVA